MMRTIQLCLMVAVLSGCQTVTETRLVCPDVPEIPNPDVPTVTGEELACLSDAAFERLDHLDRIRRAHVADLQATLAGIREECERLEDQ